MFVPVFIVATVLCLLLLFYTRAKSAASTDEAFSVFRRCYLAVYLLGTAGDWLQGPYVYALYEAYGMTKHQIEILFIAGFGSSMLFGTVVGSVADKFGRRLNCYVYGVLYGIACVTKHFNDFNILMVGRILGGVATSILFSAFESWLVYEHHTRGFSNEALSTLFSQAVFGNSLVAIIAGVVAQLAASYIGFVAPFDVSLVVLMVMCVTIYFLWTENYGDASADVHASFKEAWASIRNDPKIFYLGLIQSLFEGSMYVFVLEWTPALTKASSGEKIPHGLIFATFMVCVMIASSLYKLLTDRVKVESFMRAVFAVAAVSLLVPILFPSNLLVVFLSFLVFEMCVGLFWPSMGYMRSLYIPEKARATIMNLFRVPLNIVVVVILLNNLSLHTIFGCCSAFLALSALFQHLLYRQASLTPAATPTEVKEIIMT